ncbi:hypothetical protein [Staphylococcus simulans]|uniref:hypothetical protein n=1 Tax=Staphylococcus simulans TaxID=1286 RepID=UPI0027FCC46C|nr:hypothetical protein [Staphylococcus simulans]MDQ7113920.1 hypothetical protein [Staphylococcus simulans]MDQ7117669.1 hypothetical protein [Staphylococcus simulans]
MKTKEFIKRVEDMGFEVHTEKNMTYVNKNLENLSYIDEEYTNTINTVLRTFARLEDKKREKLFKAIVEYASTPPEERKEEKKYYIKHKYLRKHNAYLNYDKSLQEWTFHTKSNAVNLKTQFTLAELPEWVHETIEDGYLVKEEVE